VDEDGTVKRSTAVRHLVEMGEAASEQSRWRGTDIGWPLDEIWASGEFLDEAVELDVGSVVLMLDVSADELPWLSLHPAGESVGERLRLGKRPLLWSYRPSDWPAWNARHRRVVRVWSVAGGTDEIAIEALRTGDFSAVVTPTPDEFLEQLEMELESSRAHLRRIVAGYWEPEWRRRHRGASREDHLWRAASAVTELEDVLGPD
jgi:hypothetical protein